MEDDGFAPCPGCGAFIAADLGRCPACLTETGWAHPPPLSEEVPMCPECGGRHAGTSCVPGDHATPGDRTAVCPMCGTKTSASSDFPVLRCPTCLYPMTGRGRLTGKGS
jgi:hypothetical protein